MPNLNDELIAAGLLDPPEDTAGAANAPDTANRPQIDSQSSNPDFVPPTWFPVLELAVRVKRGATLFGPRGCGKSTAIRELAQRVGARTVTMQCAANMQLDSLIGSWCAEGGTMRFIDGPLTQAVREGAWLIAEEANVIHPGVWSATNNLTDSTAEGLRLPSGEVLPFAPDFRLILVYNEGYAGTREVNAALKDRLPPVYCGYLDSDQEIQILQSMTGAHEPDCRRVREVADLVRAANIRFDLSPRALAWWLQLVGAGFSWRDGFCVAIMDLVGPPDTAAPQRALLEEIAKNTIDQWA